jgi:hypothetical protein
MAYPFRIEKRSAIQAQADGAEQPTDALQEYLARVIRLIPAEVVALYQAIRGIVEAVAPNDPTAKATLPWLPVIGLVIVVFVRSWGTRTADGDWSTVQWGAVLIAAVSFLVWVVSLGHPIVVDTPIRPWIGSVVLILWAFFSPYFYKEK